MGFIFFSPLIFTKEKLRLRGKEFSQCHTSFASNKIKYQILVRNEKHYTEILFPQFIFLLLPVVSVPIFLRTSLVETLSFHLSG